MSYKESEEENAAQADSNDLQQQGRKRKLKAMEDEASSKKVVAVQCFEDIIAMFPIKLAMC